MSPLSRLYGNGAWWLPSSGLTAAATLTINLGEMYIITAVLTQGKYQSGAAHAYLPLLAWVVM